MGERLEWHGQGREHGGELLARRGEWSVVACEGCGFAHALPLPGEKELTEVYRHEYYSTEKPLYLERAREDLDWWRELHSRRLGEFEAHKKSPGKRLLDVGSGPGFLLQRAAELGWECLGIEPSQQAAEHARSLGVEVLEDFLDQQVASAIGQFDAVHLSEVLEHLPDPTAMVGICHELLLPGGVLSVSVPNDFNPLQETLRERGSHEAWWVAPPHHLNYFNFESLEGLLRRAGLEVLQRNTSFPLEFFLLMGEDYVGNDGVGRLCHGKRMAFERALLDGGRGDLLNAIYNSFAQLGIGRLAVVLAQKP